MKDLRIEGIVRFVYRYVVKVQCGVSLLGQGVGAYAATHLNLT